MSRCAHCGTPVQWIRLPGGDYEPVEFLDDGDGRTERRQTLAGPVGGALAAFVPHRRYCPGGRK